MAAITVEKELLELEKQYWQGLKEGDVDVVLHLTDFPCIIAGSQGIRSVDKQTFATIMKDPRYTIHRVELSDDAQVRLLKDDVAVVAYTVREEVTVNGKRLTIEAADSSTWIRRSGQWQCSHHTEAIIGDPFGRDRTGAETSTDGAAGSEDERAIRGVIEKWMAASKAGDLPTVLSLMADDIIFMVPGREPFGKEAFATNSRQMKDVRVEGTADVLELHVLGEWAWCRTRLVVTITPPQGTPATRSGSTLTIFRKQPHGWVIARDANLLTAQ